MRRKRSVKSAISPIDLEIAKATLADLPEMCRLSKQVHLLHCNRAPHFFHSFSEKAFRRFFKQLIGQNDYFVWVAKAGRRTYGFAVFEVQARRNNPIVKAQRFLYLDQICTDRFARRKGVGKALLRHGLKEATRRGFKEVILDVWDFNQTAQAFFKAHGFRYQIHRLTRKI